MRIRTNLRLLRAGRPLRQVAELAGIDRGLLSRFERGRALPSDQQLQRLELVYGPADGWYPPTVLAALAPDLDPCPGCELPLDPSTSRRRKFHDDSCRAQARKSAA